MLESSNVAHPIFTPSESGTVMAFDTNELLNVSRPLALDLEMRS